MSVTGGDLKKIKEIVEEFVEKMGVNLQVDTSGDINGVKINLNGPDSALMIGFHGETLTDLAYLISQIIKKRINKEERIRVDINGYLDNKDKKIKEITLKAIEKVRHSGFPEEINNMNSYERRIAHTVVANEGLASESRGFGKERKLIIKPLEK
jgi:spoIIIJ-associated protein